MHLRQQKSRFPENVRAAFRSPLPAAGASRRVNRLLLSLALALALAGCGGENSWHVEEVTGHLPNLHFSLTSDSGSAVTARKFEGYLLLLYFGYTHCNTECPVSLSRLARVIRMLGDSENGVRVLFVSLDPARDTPDVLRRYIAQFDSEQTIGLTGTVADIELLAKQYRTAYRPRQKIGETTDIEHGDAVYIFDSRGRARLLAASSDSDEHLAHDLRRLMQDAHQAGPL
jgi:protein SCO1/2